MLGCHAALCRDSRLAKGGTAPGSRGRGYDAAAAAACKQRKEKKRRRGRRNMRQALKRWMRCHTLKKKANSWGGGDGSGPDVQVCIVIIYYYCLSFILRHHRMNEWNEWSLLSLCLQTKSVLGWATTGFFVTVWSSIWLNKHHDTHKIEYKKQIYYDKIWNEAKTDIIWPEGNEEMMQICNERERRGKDGWQAWRVRRGVVIGGAWLTSAHSSAHIFGGSTRNTGTPRI